MKIIWDEEKYRKLIIERGIDLAEIGDKILNKNYIEIRQNPARPNQMLFLINHNNYTYAVPFVVDKDSNIVIKTAYPSSKFHKIVGGKL